MAFVDARSVEEGEARSATRTSDTKTSRTPLPFTIASALDPDTITRSRLSERHVSQGRYRRKDRTAGHSPGESDDRRPRARRYHARKRRGGRVHVLCTPNPSSAAHRHFLIVHLDLQRLEGCRAVPTGSLVRHGAWGRQLTENVQAHYIFLTPSRRAPHPPHSDAVCPPPGWPAVLMPIARTCSLPTRSVTRVVPVTMQGDRASVSTSGTARE